MTVEFFRRNARANRIVAPQPARILGGQNTAISDLRIGRLKNGINRVSMENFKKGGFKKMGGAFGARSKFGSGKKFGGNFSGGRDGGNRPGGYTELFAAVCSTCKKNCKVPFRPTGDKPVYCRDCFDRQEQVPGRNSQRRDRSSAQNEDGIAALKRQLIVLESKINRILELVSKKVL